MLTPTLTLTATHTHTHIHTHMLTITLTSTLTHPHTHTCCSGAELEVRDIATRPEWEGAYSMTIPVLAAAAPDGSREVRL
jgi:hypothetical protein